MTAQTSPARPATVPEEARAHVEDLGVFVTASPSSYHAAAEVARRSEAAGFTRLDEESDWTPSTTAGRHVVVRDGAVIAWVRPAAAGPTTPFRILGAHTDSPGFKLKPQADRSARTAGCRPASRSTAGRC